MSKKSLFLLSLCILLVVLAVVASRLAQDLFYYPDQIDYGRSPAHYGQTFTELTITTADGEQLHGWFVPSQLHDNPKDALGTILHYHGNAANITAHYLAVAWLPGEGYNLITFDYRGYGKSTGEPSFKGVYQDGISALAFAENYPEIDPNKLFVFGQSLGGNVAIASVGSSATQNVRGMIIDSTFYGYSEIANDKLSGMQWLVSDEFSAYQYLDKLHMPIFYFHGDADQLIPHRHSAALFAKTNAPKANMVLADTRHIEGIFNPQVQNNFLVFLQQALQQDCCNLSL